MADLTLRERRAREARLRELIRRYAQVVAGLLSDDPLARQVAAAEGKRVYADCISEGVQFATEH